MPKGPERTKGADLVSAFQKARERFIDAATRWIRARQSFLIRTGKQPKRDQDDEPPRR